MKMKNCELCTGLARMHCESDRASLCWSCDYKVHSANFLVARHSRTLLCQVCQSPTPWKATGFKLGPTVSVCDSCFQNFNKINSNEESEARNEDEEMDSDNFDDDDEDDDEYDCEEDTDCEDNQVVPWSPSTPPPPSTANSPSDRDAESYSSSSISSSCNPRGVQRKRTRENTDRCYNVNCVSSPSHGNADTPLRTTNVGVFEAAVEEENSYGADKGWADSVDSLSTVLKKRRIKTGESKIPGSRSWVLIESIKRLHQEEMMSTEAIAELRRLCVDPSSRRL